MSIFEFCILALCAGALALTGWWVWLNRPVRQSILWPSYTQVIAPTVELAAAEELIAAQAQVIHTLSTFTVEPVSDWSVLPWQSPPTRVEVAVSHRLAELVADLRIELATVVRERDYFRDLKTRHWVALRKARARIRELTPRVLLYSDFERECSFKQDYHAKARSFLERIQTTQELVEAGAMRAEIKAALNGTLTEFPTTRPIERIAA